MGEDRPGEGAYMGKPKLKSHRINREWCKGCGICANECPVDAIKMVRARV